MIQLNLLPPEYRKKKSSFTLEQLPGVHALPLQLLSGLPLQRIYLFVGGGLLALYTLAFLGVQINALTLKRLETEWAQLSQEREKIKQMTQNYTELEATEKAVEKLHHQFRWSQKLQQLSDSMVRGVWLRELSLGEYHGEGVVLPGGAQSGNQPERVLILTGTAASPKGDQTALVGRFIRSLNENKDFFADFKGVKLESIKRRTIQSLDVMDFKILCTFREGVLE